MEASRTRSGATQILQSQFFDIFKGFALTPDLLVQLQRMISYFDLLLNLETGDAPLVVARLRQLDILLQTVSALVISLGRQNPGINKYVRSCVELLEPTLLALFQAYCNTEVDLTSHALAPAVWQIMTLLDNLKDILGEDNMV